ncbi:ANR family transcriptional regulator [Pasteurellaceae bacterium USgator11]|nr:ANR family transcriptional regulator [Pasteurellaceae bacterium USgator41]TNG98686.1 ANR family transcriptional regulator [Pasteurellaceae bacterium UScroc31]TNH00053.1 ANR family transcriptional regulator [Pasteurellaceae bacterium USgator11]
MDKSAEKIDFTTVAEQAALLEKEESFHKASIAWEKAATLAKNSANRDWAEIRSRFCYRWKNRIKRGS